MIDYLPTPPPVEPPSASPGAKRNFLAPLALLLGLAIGGGGILLRDQIQRTPTSPIAEVQVNGGPAPSAGNVATSVAKSLGPSVGTVVGGLSGQFQEGSAFVFASSATNSDLITNNHVVAGTDSLSLAMPSGRTTAATLVGTDSLDDIAVISVPIGNLPVSTFGNSDNLAVGQTVIAIGSPLGNVGSVTEGVISALHRTIQAGDQSSSQTETLQDVLQTDAPISPGNSGGPLADAGGRVVGVNVATASSGTGGSNIGYSIPGNLARTVAEQLLAHQPVQHPFLGIGYLTQIQAIEAGHSFDGAGVYVSRVQAGSPAGKAGFQVGDILQAINRTSIDNGVTLGGLIQRLKVGDVIQCTIKRGAQTLTLSATLVERPAAG